VREACAWVADRARDVKVGPLGDAVAALRQRQLPAWDDRRHFSGTSSRTRLYILVLDTVNFCFWGAGGGYWRLAEGLRDAFRAGDALADSKRLAVLDAPGLERWTGDLTLMEQRAAALRELGRLGLDGLGGDLEKLIETTAAGTAAGLARHLGSFRDVAVYDGKEVPLLKRAQIAAADLAGAGLADFPDLSALTCFADYKLPQALRHLGALEYSERLARRVDDWRELEAGEAAEVEIRAATVVCVERLRDQLAAEGRPLRAVEIDWMLWALSQELYPVRPHHRTRTVFY
jgi:hypothetical protein